MIWIERIKDKFTDKLKLSHFSKRRTRLFVTKTRVISTNYEKDLDPVRYKTEKIWLH